MPTKRNKAGNQQNYVPAGHGDASGEYGDNATGSNKHFQSFRKPQEQSKKLREKKKQKFKYNKYYKTWDVISDEDYDKYKKLKDKGYFSGIELKEEEINILSDDEKNEIQNEVVSTMDKEIDNANIDTIKNYISQYSESYKNALMESVKKYDLNDYEKGFATNVQERKKILPDEVMEKLENKAKEKALKLSQEYIDKNFSKIKGEHTIEQDLIAVNPHYKEGGYYTINCQRCSFAYELRRRGYNVEAFPNKNDFGSYGSWLSQMKFKEKYSFANKVGAKKLAQSIIDKVKAQDGSRWAVDVQWRGRRTGHLFIAENVNGEVKFFDAQMGNQNAINYLNSVATTKETIIYRMDNADFNYGVKETGFTPK